jgi:DNA-binding response OmpR family regulator
MAFVNGAPLELTAREVAVLEIFLQRVGATIPKDRLTDLLSSWDEEVSENAVGIIVHRLRKKLEHSELTIRALRGLGYRLEKVD